MRPVVTFVRDKHEVANAQDRVIVQPIAEHLRAVKWMQPISPAASGNSALFNGCVACMRDVADDND